MKHTGIKPSELSAVSESTRRRNPGLFPPASSLSPAAGEPGRRIRQRQAPKMNRTEMRLLEWLKGPHAIGEHIYCQEMILELANGLTYRPDFFVPMVRLDDSGTLESIATIYEAKGAHAWDDAIAKLKTAARVWPCFTFFLAWESEGNWKLQKILP